MNKKKKRIGLGIVVLVAIGAILGAFWYQNQKEVKRREQEEQEKVREIKNAFSDQVEVSQRKKIYVKKDALYQEIGFIEKGVFLSLEPTNVKTSRNIYFKIKDSNYYIDYQGIKKASFSLDNSLNNFLVNKIIKTSKTELYKDGILSISLEEEHQFDVLAHINEEYYVRFLGDIYTIREQGLVEEKECDELLDKISVLSFNEDISKEKVEEVFSILKEENYETITFLEFIYWMKGYANMGNKKVLLIGSEKEQEILKELLENYSYKMEIPEDNYSFEIGDSQLKVGDTRYYKYQISNQTSGKRVKEMLQGIIEEKNVLKQVAVLNYHFFYDASTEGCNESICLSTENFKKQLDYLRDNGYKTLTMQEFYDWKVGKIELPKKSVLLTVDDGAMGTSSHLPAILEEYKMHASLFLITGWWDIANYQKSSYLEIYSHGNELHHNNYCNSSGCGFKPLLLSKEEIIEDLNTSFEIVSSRLAFCYPFYKTNKNLENALRETGVSVAFVGGGKKATRNVSNYYIPRYVIYKNTSLSEFIKMVS